MSLRFISQYEATIANQSLAAIPKRKNMYFDVLFTYFVHPGTALYIGYNSNLSNLDRALYYDSNLGDYRRVNRFTNDGRQIFAKLSYLFRFEFILIAAKDTDADRTSPPHTFPNSTANPRYDPDELTGPYLRKSLIPFNQRFLCFRRPK